MAKTLVIAEKPSVGQDLARVLPGPFQKHTGAGEKTARWLEGPEHVITWAVGHLVQLAEPDEYDERFKKWRMADLPIVPRRFKLVVRDERSQKQMSAVASLLGREDVDRVVNACDAGREGELIFAYLYEYARSDKPVERLWLSSMTERGDARGLGALRPADELTRLREAAKSRSEADWIVGMNATRAATIRLRSSFDGAVSLGRVQTPTLAILARREEEIRAFRAGDLLARRRRVRGRRRRALRGPLPRRRAAAAGQRRGGRRRSSRRSAAAAGRSPSSTRPSAPSARRSCTTSPRCSATRTRASASPRGARWPPRSAATRSTRRSPIRARARAT